MIHTHKRSLMKSKTKKKGRGSRARSKLSFTGKQKRRRNNGDTKKPTIYYTQTHSLIGGKAEKKIVFSYVYFRVV